MQSLLRNLRFAFRMMANNPGTTLAILLTLTLGIGANSAIFSVTDALLLRPFPFRNPAQLVHIALKGQTSGNDMNLVRFESLRDNSRSFEQVAAWAAQFRDVRDPSGHVWRLTQINQRRDA